MMCQMRNWIERQKCLPEKIAWGNHHFNTWLKPASHPWWQWGGLYIIFQGKLYWCEKNIFGFLGFYLTPSQPTWGRAHWNCNTHLKKLFRFRELNLLESLKLWNPAWIYISYIVWESMMMPLPRTYFVTSALLAICCLRSNSQSQRHKCCTVWKISIWIKIYYWY